MWLDRRRFLALAAQLGMLAAGSRAATPPRLDAAWIHRETRNTRSGMVGSALRALAATTPPAKSYAGRERIALRRADWRDAPPLVQLLRAGEPPARDPSFAELGRILHLANGVTGVRGSGSEATQLRAAPSAGALYSNELYVAVERVPGLEPGLFFYDVLGDALVALRRGSQRARLAEALGASLGQSPVIVLHTNVFGRYVARYAARGYRYALIDTGHVAENLELAALATGIPAQRVVRFEDDALHALLDVDGREEAVCAVTLLGAPPAVSSRRLVERQTLGAPAEGDPTIVRFHDATKLVPAASDGAGAIDCAATFARVVALAAPASARLAPAASVDAAILARRSAAGFADAPIAADELRLVADAAVSRSGGALELLSLLVMVHRVRDVRTGLHAHDAASGALSLLRPGDASAALERACLGQELAAQAAAAFFVVGDLAAIDARCGARGYRDALVESGRIAERIYLAAGALGLQARNLAAFTDDELNELLGIADGSRVALHLTVVGA
jgi:SagB-type dehydrogenase family enzyme